jgi:uncharacterized protein
MGERAGLRIAVIGSGISGLSAAWLLSRRHDVALIERAVRAGGHSRTIDVEIAGKPIPVDTGFIVYNETTYRNLTQLFAHLGVDTQPSDMSFSVSLDQGKLEYAGSRDRKGLFAQKRNLINPRFWSMLRDLVRFYREAPAHAGKLGLATLGEFLAEHRYGKAFRDDHLLPMAAAIWSAPTPAILDYPAEAFIRFCENHGLLKLNDRPRWRTVASGSRTYVKTILADFHGEVRLGAGVVQIERKPTGVWIDGERFDRVVIATHADTALRLLADPSAAERHLLGAFRYSRNAAVLHSDPALMPVRRKTWSSWNYLGTRRPGADTSDLCVSYWMNRLQGLGPERDLFVTLNPRTPPRPETVIDSVMFDHPLFDADAMQAQRDFWATQGERGTYYCGAWLGSGFHEDGLQAGLAVAEMLGVQRPWNLDDPSDRLHLSPTPLALAA